MPPQILEKLRKVSEESSTKCGGISMSKLDDFCTRPTGMNLVEENGKIWMVLLNRNGICEIDKVTRRARICGIFEGEPLEKEKLYAYVERVDDYLIFCPWEAEKIAIYHIKRKLIKYIPLKKTEGIYKEAQDGAKFGNMVRYGMDVYLLGFSYPAIVKLNIKSMEVTYITGWVDAVENMIVPGDTNGYFSDGHVIIGNMLIIPLGPVNAVLELDLETDRFRFRKVDIPMERIGGISSADRENVWIVGKGRKSNRISCWNLKTEKVSEYCLSDLEEDMIHPFYAPICTATTVYLFPINASCIYEISVAEGRSGKSRVLERPFKEPKDSLWPYWRTMAPEIKGNLLRFLSCDDLVWHEYDVATGEGINYSVLLEEESEDRETYFDAVYVKWKQDNDICLETDFSLGFFMNRMTRLPKEDLCRENPAICVGGRIYDDLS